MIWGWGWDWMFLMTLFDVGGYVCTVGDLYLCIFHKYVSILYFHKKSVSNYENMRATYLPPTPIFVGVGCIGGRLVPIQLFVRWHNRAGNRNTRHLDLVLQANMVVVLGLGLGLWLWLWLGLRNTHLNRRTERVLCDSFDAYNVVNDSLCFFQIISDPILRGLLLLLLPTCGYQCSQVFQLHDN